MSSFIATADFNARHFSRRISLPLVLAVIVLTATAMIAGIGGYLLHAVLASRSGSTANLPAAVAKRLPIRTFGHWNLVCVQDVNGAKRCEILLRVVDQTSRKSVLNIAVGRSRENQTILVIVTPPNALTQEGVQLTAADAAPKVANLTCGNRACRGVIPVTEDLQKQFASSGTLRVSYKTNAGRAVQYELPNDGFAKALAAWQDATAG